MRVANPSSVRAAIHPTVLDIDLALRGALTGEYLSSGFESDPMNIATLCATF
jgi:hypothetical protein